MLREGICPDCSTALAKSTFCPQTGQRHVPAAVCARCGLDSPFCAVSGEPHHQQSSVLRHRGRNKREISEPKHDDGETPKPMLRQTVPLRAKLSAEQAAYLDALGADGFGIFAPGNPALDRVRSSAAGKNIDTSVDDFEGHRLNVPESVLHDILSVAAGGRLTDHQRAMLARHQKPWWQRRFGPLVKGVLLILSVVAVLGVVQLMATVMLRPGAAA